MIPVVNRIPWPVDHPEYCYPPSRNPYGKKLNDTFPFVLSDHATEIHHGSWRSQFNPPTLQLAASSGGELNRELHLEIGCNAGHVLVEWAKKNPQNLYVGIDWKFKAIFKAAEKVVKANLSNVCFLRAHAERLPFMFAEEELDSISLFFPDPWPKTVHWKHRFVSRKNLLMIEGLLKPKGTLHIKTDHDGYFQWMLKAFKGLEDKYDVIHQSSDLHQDEEHPEQLKIPDVTLFEKIFIRQGIPIKQLKLQKR